MRKKCILFDWGNIVESHQTGYSCYKAWDDLLNKCGYKGEVSLDEPLNKDSDGNELLLSDILGTDEDITSRNIEDEVDKRLLKASISKLNSREKNIMEMRFGFKRKSRKKVY